MMRRLRMPTAWLVIMMLPLLMAMLLPGTADGSAVLIADLTMSVMVELSSRHPFCKMHTDRGDIQHMLFRIADPRRIRQVPRESVMELEEVCKNVGSHGTEFRGGLGFIYPGTKWCGPGTAALNYNDLGHHAAEDRCCREHDLCPDVLNVGECRRGLCNYGTFTRSHCDCDARLRRCLQSINTETANTIGAIFYNVVQVTCFQERSPCSAHQRFDGDFFYSNRPAQCGLEFHAADLFVPPSAGNLIQRILAQPHGLTQSEYFAPHGNGRSLDADGGGGSFLPTSLKQHVDQLSRRFGVRVASLGLAALNIFREIVQSPRAVWDSLHMPVRREVPADAQRYHQRHDAGGGGSRAGDYGSGYHGGDDGDYGRGGYDGGGYNGGGYNGRSYNGGSSRGGGGDGYNYAGWPRSPPSYYNHWRQ